MSGEDFICAAEVVVIRSSSHRFHHFAKHKLTGLDFVNRRSRILVLNNFCLLRLAW